MSNADTRTPSDVPVPGTNLDSFGGEVMGASRADALERALVKISQAAEVLWDPMGGMPVYAELTDLCQAILDAREVLVDQSEAER